MGYDKFRGFWGDSLDSCDAWHSWTATPAYATNNLTDPNVGAWLQNALPGYWEQDPSHPDSNMCGYFESLAHNGILTEQEASVGCKSTPRGLPKLMDLDLLDGVISNIETHDYEEGPFLQVFATQMMHLPMNYPKKYDTESPNPLQPDYFQDGRVKPNATNDDLRLATANGVTYVDDVFGETMKAIKNAGQWDNTIVLFTSGELLHDCLLLLIWLLARN